MKNQILHENERGGKAVILLTGATGFVGRRVAAELIRRGKAVRCLVRRTSPLSMLQSLPVEFTYGDVTDPASLPPAVAGAEAIIHLVAIIHERGRATFERENYGGTMNLLRAAKEAGVERFLYMSNIGASPDPRFPFLLSKWWAEEEVKRSGLAYTIFRSSVMFGEGDIFIRTLAKWVRRTPVVPILGDGKTQFQLIWVEDAARCLATALEDKAYRGKTVELGGPEHLTYEEIVDLLIATLGKRRLKLHIPLPLMRPAARIMERALANPLITTHQLSMLFHHNITDLKAVEKSFGFTPTSLLQAIDYIQEPVPQIPYMKLEQHRVQI